MGEEEGGEPLETSRDHFRGQSAGFIPFNYPKFLMATGDFWMVRDTGFEPVTPSVSGRCSTTELTAHEFRLAGAGD